MKLTCMLDSEYMTGFYVIDKPRKFWRDLLKLQDWLRKIRKAPMPDGLFMTVDGKFYTVLDEDEDARTIGLEQQWMPGEFQFRGEDELYEFAKLFIQRDHFWVENGEACSIESLTRKQLIDFVKKYAPSKSVLEKRSKRRSERITTKIPKEDSIDDSGDEEFAFEGEE